MRLKFQIGDRFIDLSDRQVGTIVEMHVEMHNDPFPLHGPFPPHYPTAPGAYRFRIKWPCIFDDHIHIWYYEEELVREIEEKIILRAGNANKIWKDLNEV